MEPPDPSFTDEFNVPQEDAVLVLLIEYKPLSLHGSIALSSYIIVNLFSYYVNRGSVGGGEVYGVVAQEPRRG